jgi:hypothetical protein
MKKEIVYEIEYMDPDTKYQFWHPIQKNVYGKTMVNNLCKDFAKRNPTFNLRVKKITIEVIKTIERIKK